jgi:archaellum biogenesis ATPase FlaH
MINPFTNSHSIDRPEVSAVFTPRAADVNEEMYVQRLELEKELSRAIKGALHIVVHGESGAGKSWLYKKVLKQLGIRYEIANCANVARKGSFDYEFQNIQNREGGAEKTGYTETKSAEVNVAVAKGALEHEGNYEIRRKEPLESLLESMSAKGMTLLVMDNLEAIMDDAARMTELGNIITLLDDGNYARYNVKLLIVGVPADVRDYFGRIRNQATVANRLSEIPEVSVLTREQVETLVKRGFLEKLRIEVQPDVLATWLEHINSITLGIPQRLHEYCEGLAYACEDQEWQASVDLLQRADERWLSTGISQAYSIVQLVMNDRRTTAGRRNQVLFALGHVNNDTFRSPDVEEQVRKLFPNSTQDRTLAVGQILADLANRQSPIIKRTTKGDAYQFCDPRYLMCIRVMLDRSQDGQGVVRRDFSRLQH